MSSSARWYGRQSSLKLPLVLVLMLLAQTMAIASARHLLEEGNETTEAAPESPSEGEQDGSDKDPEVWSRDGYSTGVLGSVLRKFGIGSFAEPPPEPPPAPASLLDKMQHKARGIHKHLKDATSDLQHQVTGVATEWGLIAAPPPPPASLLDWVGEAAKKEWMDAKAGLTKATSTVKGGAAKLASDIGLIPAPPPPSPPFYSLDQIAQKVGVDDAQLDIKLKDLPPWPVMVALALAGAIFGFLTMAHNGYYQHAFARSAVSRQADKASADDKEEKGKKWNLKKQRFPAPNY